MDLTIGGVARPNQPTDDQLSRMRLEFAAFDGEVGNGEYPIDDAAKTFDVATGRQFRVDEGATLLTDGFMLDQDRARGFEPEGREYSLGVQDANALLDGFRIFRRRDAETDVARVLAFAAADYPDWDTSMVLVANTVTMPKKTYDSDGGWTSELIPDVVEFTGKTLFVHDKADGSGRCLHYHTLNSGHACGLSISDVPGAENGTTVWYPWNPLRSRTSVDLRNSIKGRDQNGRTSIHSDSGSIAAHDADGLQHEALVQYEAGSQSDLNAQTAATLASFKDDLDTWSCSIGPLDEDALALIRVGDIMTVTSDVMGLTAGEKRIAHLTLSPALSEAGTTIPDKWMADLELGAPKRRRARVANRATVDRTRHTPVPDPLVGAVAACYPAGSFGDWSTPAGSPPTGGSILLNRGGAGNALEYDATAGSVVGADQFYGAVQLTFDDPLSAPSAIVTFDINVGALDPATSAATLTISLGVDGGAAGAASYVFVGSGGFTSAVPVWDAGTAYVIGDHVWSAGQVYIATANGTNHEPPNGAFWALAGYYLAASHHWKGKLYVSAFSRASSLWSATEDEPDDWNYNPLTSPGGTFTPFSALRSGLVVTSVTGTTFPDTVSITNIQICYEGSGAQTAYHWTVYGPVAVQETPDGATSTFTIPTYPGGSGYVPGTLVILVDGIEQTTTQTDPAAGTGTISWEPEADNVVTCRFLVP